mmetsp:Transcript_34051/g.79097  ORF Transcript_34051/g.79097 Transcript_34051/m.79097 type:complete len:238 (+) Transcript_34051:176-889(+)
MTICLAPMSPKVFPLRSSSAILSLGNRATKRSTPAEPMQLPARVSVSTYCDGIVRSMSTKAMASWSPQPRPAKLNETAPPSASWKVSRYLSTRSSQSAMSVKHLARSTVAKASGRSGTSRWALQASKTSLGLPSLSKARSRTWLLSESRLLTALSKLGQPLLENARAADPFGGSVSISFQTCLCANQSSASWRLRRKAASSTSSRGRWCKLHQSRKTAASPPQCASSRGRTFARALS